MEYWENVEFLFTTLQYSNTPLLHGRTTKEAKVNIDISDTPKSNV